MGMIKLKLRDKPEGKYMLFNKFYELVDGVHGPDRTIWKYDNKTYMVNDGDDYQEEIKYWWYDPELGELSEADGTANVAHDLVSIENGEYIPYDTNKV